MLRKPRFLIRTRILILGFALAAFGVTVPLLLKKDVARLASLYELIVDSEAFTEQSFELDATILLLTLELSEKSDNAKETLEQVNQQIRTLEDRRLPPSAMPGARQLRETFALWRTTTLAAVFSGERYTPMSDALAAQIRAINEELRMHLSAADHQSRVQLIEHSQKTARKIGIIASIFLIFVLTLVASLWFTMIPRFSALLAVIQGFQKRQYKLRAPVHDQSEISEIARAFNEMADQVAASNNQKNEFVSTVSHELRTPLTAIRGAVGLLLGGVMGKLPRDAEDLLRLTEKNADRLNRLISGILDIAKIEAGVFRLEFEKVNLTTIIDQVIAYLKPVAASQQVNLLWNPPSNTPLVVIDRDRIEQVLLNLLSNAIKFCQKNGRVTVSVDLADSEKRIRIHVVDNGNGIPADFQDRIFQKFQQVEESLHKNKEGSGLGLAIAKAIVEEHQGQIGVSSSPGTGSDFWFDLPWTGEFSEDAAPSKAA